MKTMTIQCTYCPAELDNGTDTFGTRSCPVCVTCYHVSQDAYRAKRAGAFERIATMKTRATRCAFCADALRGDTDTFGTTTEPLCVTCYHVSQDDYREKRAGAFEQIAYGLAHGRHETVVMVRAATLLQEGAA